MCSEHLILYPPLLAGVTLGEEAGSGALLAVLGWADWATAKSQLGFFPFPRLLVREQELPSSLSPAFNPPHPTSLPSSHLLLSAAQGGTAPSAPVRDTRGVRRSRGHSPVAFKSRGPPSQYSSFDTFQIDDSFQTISIKLSLERRNRGK